jgi:hypothetical protein
MLGNDRNCGRKPPEGPVGAHLFVAQPGSFRAAERPKVVESERLGEMPQAVLTVRLNTAAYVAL